MMRGVDDSLTSPGVSIGEALLEPVCCWDEYGLGSGDDALDTGNETGSNAKLLILLCCNREPWRPKLILLSSACASGVNCACGLG